MEKPSHSLTRIQNDWSQNIVALQEILREGERLVVQKTDQRAEPLLNTPNLPNLRGYIRWALVPALLEQAISSNKLSGVKGKWVSLGGVSVFEMSTTFTRVTPYHMREPDETPRESAFRKVGRTENQWAGYFPFFEKEHEGDDQPQINLLLCYGGADSDFAYLRAYYDKDKRSVYRQFSANIMREPTLLDSFEAEAIQEPEVKFNPSVIFKNKQKEA